MLLVRGWSACGAAVRRAHAAAQLDPALRPGFARAEYKARRHPGVVQLKTAQLPKELVQALGVVLQDAEARALQLESLRLEAYLRSRREPPEQRVIDATAAQIYERMGHKEKDSQAAVECGEAEKDRLLRERNMKLYGMLKKRIYRWANIAYDRPTCLQYLMVRASAEYAVLCRILEEIATALPDYKPRSFFDFGSGVGTGTWAVDRYWKNHIFEYFCVDTSPEMHELARLILCGGRENVDLPVKGYFQRQFLPASSQPKYNIVVSAYSLFELPSAKSRLETIQKLWNKTEDFLIIVEQGTNAGFKLVNEVRDFVLDTPKGAQSGYVFAPCPNDNVCPRYLEQETPCNFLMRYHSLPFPSKSEIKAELFSYVVLKKGIRPEDDKRWPRIVRAPIVRGRHTICKLCTAQGELKEIVFSKKKHDRDTYWCARASCWGDRLPIEINNSINEVAAEEVITK